MAFPDRLEGVCREPNLRKGAGARKRVLWFDNSDTVDRKLH
jgi:hypothetical protein